MIVAARIYDNVREAIEAAVTQRESLIEGLTVRVDNALPLIEGSARVDLHLVQLLQECVVPYDGLDFHVLLLLSLDVEVDTCLILGPGPHAGECLATEGVSISYRVRKQLVDDVYEGYLSL